MHRKPLLRLLDLYRAMYPHEHEVVARFATFVSSHTDCFERSCVPGHVTASAWILSPDGNRFLMTHHRKLGRWLQVGGHADGQFVVHEAAMREAHEETGISDFSVMATDGEHVPLDIDIHVIPPHGTDPEHLHYDVRFLMQARTDRFVVSKESHALQWFAMSELDRICTEPSLLRMGEKARSILEHVAPDDDSDDSDGGAPDGGSDGGGGGDGD
jgi:8-oxo-dGTP pyrophosphatase MutT (NUDIX family)